MDSLHFNKINFSNKLNTKTPEFRRGKEKVLRAIFFLASVLAILLVFSIITFIFLQTLPFFKTVKLSEFLFSKNWRPSGKIPSYGILSFIVSTIYMTSIAMLLSLPISICVAIYISEYADEKIKKLLRSFVNILASFPSVIIGLVGIRAIVPFVGRISKTSGYSLISGSIVLSIMLMPTIINISEQSFAGVAKDLRAVSYSLAASKSQTIWRVVLPASRRGIMTAIIMALSRAFGETTAVLLVAGNAPVFPSSIFSKTRSMTMNIQTDMSYAEGVHLSALFATSFLLLIIILALNCFLLFWTKRRMNGER